MMNEKNIKDAEDLKEFYESELSSSGNSVKLEGTALALSARLRAVVSTLVSEMILSPTLIAEIIADGITDGIETLAKGER